MMARHTKINTTKSFTFEIVMPSHFERGQSLTWYVDRAMALRRYFKPLSTHVSPGAIKDANEAVRNVSQGSSKPRGKYAKFTPEQKASIGEYASLHGNQAAIHCFSKQLGVEMKPTSVQTWKGKYLAEISRKRKAGETSNVSVKSLPVKKRGRPCRRGTPSPLTPPKTTTLLTRVLARRRRIIRARKHTKIRIRKFILKTLQPFIRKFAPSKISRYTVLPITDLLEGLPR